jgi:hypothetical protein
MHAWCLADFFHNVLDLIVIRWPYVLATFVESLEIDGDEFSAGSLALDSPDSHAFDPFNRVGRIDYEHSCDNETDCGNVATSQGQDYRCAALSTDHVPQ